MKSLNCLTKDCINLIQRNRMLQPLIKAELINTTLEKVDIEPKIKDAAIKSLENSLGLIDEEKKDKWLKDNKLNWDSFITIALRDTKLKEYCKTNFSHKVESHFLDRKNELDIVIYSLIRTSNPYLAQELYLRVINNEEDFGNLATQYSEGIEKKTRGIIGPIPIQKSHPNLAYFLKNSNPGKISPPIQIEKFHLVVRLESYDPVKLDDLMREKMGQELFNIWAEKEANQLLEKLIGDEVESNSPGE